jgi:hypothetical protein
LQDFGLQLPAQTELRVFDSTAELRYLVVPMRPTGTDGWDETQLAALVTRDAMIGTGVALTPDAVALHGRYLDEHQRIATPSVLARDAGLQEALWARSLRWAGLPAEPDISGMT